MSVTDEDIKLCFDLFDKSGSGKISTADSATGLRTLGKAPSSEEMEELLKGDKTVDFNKFKGMYNAAPTAEIEDVMDAFATFDMHNGGYIALEELIHLMKNLGEGLPDPILKQIEQAAEPDSDGQVNYRHFVEKMVKDL
jgi:Ca2+-binding EF-hand superfamily protein